MTPEQAHEILTRRQPKSMSAALARQKMVEARGFLRFAHIAEKASWRHQHMQSAAKARKLAVMYLERAR